MYTNRRNCIASREPLGAKKYGNEPLEETGVLLMTSFDDMVTSDTGRHQKKVRIQMQALLFSYAHTHALPLFHSSLHGVQKDSALVAGFLQLRATLLLRECRRIHCVLELLNRIQ